VHLSAAYLLDCLVLCSATTVCTDDVKSYSFVCSFLFIKIFFNFNYITVIIIVTVVALVPWQQPHYEYFM